MSSIEDDPLFYEDYIVSGPNIRSIGHPDYEFNDIVDFIPYYFFGEGEIRIEDPLWGDCNIGDQEGDEVLLEFLDNSLVRRSMNIEQLTLPPHYSTIPNTGYFSRWEHIWGSVAFVRKMINESSELQELSSRDKIILQLRTFVSDLGHTAYSHLGDWITQGFGGPEDEHDNELQRLMEWSGGNDILRKYNIDPQEVIFPDTQDWIECDSPDLCVDRVDYALREINRWFGSIIPVELRELKNTFTVVDGQIVMKSKEHAELFANCFALLNTEHWSEPVHRLQLSLLSEMVKNTIICGELIAGYPYLDGDLLAPRDALYTVDGDFHRHQQMTDKLMMGLKPAMMDIGREQRFKSFTRRRSEISTYLYRSKSGDEDYDYPNPQEPGKYLGYMPSSNSRVQLFATEDGHGLPDYSEYGLDIPLPSLKKSRMINPLYFDERGEVISVEEGNPQFYENLRASQLRLTAQAYVGRVIMHPDYIQMLKERIEDNEKEWLKANRRERLGREAFNRLISNASYYTQPTMIRFTWAR